MSLLERIEKDFLTAYKAKDELTVAVLRMLKTAAKNKQVELKRPPTDEETLEVIARQVKQRKESIEQFTAGNRPDLADKEKAELVVLAAYMPEQVGEAELAAFIEQTIAGSGAKGPADMGRIMGAVMAKYKGRLDGKMASELVKSKLAAL
jgi:uncharacterized protein